MSLNLNEYDCWKQLLNVKDMTFRIPTVITIHLSSCLKLKGFSSAINSMHSFQTIHNKFDIPSLLCVVCSSRLKLGL